MKEIGRGLVLTRRIGETIVINDGELVIQVTNIRGFQVKLKFVGTAKIDRPERKNENQ